MAEVCIPHWIVGDEDPNKYTTAIAMANPTSSTIRVTVKLFLHDGSDALSSTHGIAPRNGIELNVEGASLINWQPGTHKTGFGTIITDNPGLVASVRKIINKSAPDMRFSETTINGGLPIS